MPVCACCEKEKGLSQLEGKWSEKRALFEQYEWSSDPGFRVIYKFTVAQDRPLRMHCNRGTIELFLKIIFRGENKDGRHLVPVIKLISLGCVHFSGRKTRLDNGNVDILLFRCA